MKKVTFLCTAYLHSNMESVINSLAEMADNKYQISIITDESRIEHKIDKRVKIYNVKTITPDIFSLCYSVIASWKYLSERDPDVFASIGKLMPLGVVVSIMGYLFSVPTLVRVTEDYINQYKSFDGFKKLRRYLINNIIVHYFIMLSSHSVPVGSNLANDMEHNGYNPEKITVIPNPFSPYPYFSLRDAEKLDFKERIGLNVKKTTVLYVSTIVEEKGADRVLYIANQVHNISNTYEFCVVGDGPYMETMKKDSPPNMKIEGFVQRENIPQYYAASDLLIYPTRSDALPNVILEAIASGLPIVATPVGEIDNYVKHIVRTDSEFVNFIIDKEWEKSNTPNWFFNNEVIEKYNEVIGRIMECRK